MGFQNNRQQQIVGSTLEEQVVENYDELVESYVEESKHQQTVPLKRHFLGSEAFCDKNSRTQLPFLTPDVPAPFWKVLKKFVGQDLTRVSLPVILNEPLTALQRFGECIVCSDELFARAAVTEDPVKRLAITAIGII